ncbi:aquaporin [Agromyces bauzanensis]
MSTGRAESRPTPFVPPARRLVAEFVGTGLLVTVVVGSGIAASKLSPDDTGLQLLENSFATALGLAVLIAMFAPLSGAHFNPVVSAADHVLGRRAGRGLAPNDLGPYVLAQVTGGIGGAVLANIMFGVETSIATTNRVSGGTLVAEVVATAGLIIVIFSLVRTDRGAIVAPVVGAYIGAAYWFTSSTSFANPAVTVGRIFSDTFAGISPTSAAAFLGAQVVGAAIGIAATALLFPVTVGEPSDELADASTAR